MDLKSLCIREMVSYPGKAFGGSYIKPKVDKFTQFVSECKVSTPHSLVLPYNWTNIGRDGTIKIEMEPDGEEEEETSGTEDSESDGDDELDIDIKSLDKSHDILPLYHWMHHLPDVETICDFSQATQSPSKVVN